VEEAVAAAAAVVAVAVSVAAELLERKFPLLINFVACAGFGQGSEMPPQLLGLQRSHE
jgi:hypothetical protein